MLLIRQLLLGEVLSVLLVDLKDLLQVFILHLLLKLLAGLLLAQIIESTDLLGHIHAFIYVRVDLLV